MADHNKNMKNVSEDEANQHPEALMNESSGDGSEETMSLWETTQSVLFAMLGVQKSKNAKRDFTKGKASHFIIIGIAFGILFVLIVALCVNVILSVATT